MTTMSLMQQIESRLTTYPSDENAAKKTIFNLEEIGGGPVSPPCTDVIRMDNDFQADQLIDAFMRNVMHNQAKLSVHIWREIVWFFNRDPADPSVRVGLQLLLHFSKVDVDVLTSERKQSFDQYITVVSRFLPLLNVSTMADQRVQLAKQFLRRPVIMTAIKLCLKHVGKKEGIDFDDAKVFNLIDSMQFYQAHTGLSIRGACLRDGIFINTRCVGAADVSENAYADFYTLVCHEAMHFIIRSLENNFNWSSPFTGTSNGQVRFFDTEATRKLELGRLMELKMFGMQPSWRESTRDAAANFLRLSENPNAALPFEIGSGLITRPGRGSTNMGFDPDYETLMME